MSDRMLPPGIDAIMMLLSSTGRLKALLGGCMIATGLKGLKNVTDSSRHCTAHKSKLKELFPADIWKPELA
jgi:hypothetical protein